MKNHGIKVQKKRETKDAELKLRVTQAMKDRVQSESRLREVADAVVVTDALALYFQTKGAPQPLADDSHETDLLRRMRNK